MTAGTKSPAMVPGKGRAYGAFQGIDRSRPRQALDTGDKQALWVCRNAHVNWRGIIQRDPPLVRRALPAGVRVDTVRFFAVDQAVWAEAHGSGITIASDRNHRYPDAFPPDSTVTMTYFRGRVHVMSAGHRMLSYSGGGFAQNTSTAAPGFGVAVSRRLAIAGMPGYPTEVWLSRVDQENVYPADEPADTSEVTKAGFIDLANLLGTADEITGLGTFEVNRLAIFTHDQVLVYVIDPDFSKWEIDNRANVRVGCISHRTIINVGSDLLFCSRHGVHALSRSATNGISITEATLTYRIEDLYREMARSVRDLTEISAAYDPDLGLYHVFFPQPDGVQCRRLTLNLAQGYEEAKWSDGDALYARCADALAGRCAFGAPGGLFTSALRNTNLELLNATKAQRGDMDVQTPVLWHGSVSDYKQARALTIQASGEGVLVVSASDEDGNELTSYTLSIEGTDEDQDTFPDQPLSRTYELPFRQRYRGLQLRFQSEGPGDIRITGFAVQLAKP